MTDADTTTLTPNAEEPSSAPQVEEGTSRTEKQRENDVVYGPIEDELFGKRIRKSFGSRAFWGTVVTCYVVGNGVFYKVSFDDGDVDILSAADVQHDMTVAKRHADKDPSVTEPEMEAAPGSAYVDALRTKKSSLKRSRDSTESESSDESAPLGSWEVKLWSLRLFATIMEEGGYIRVQDFVSMPHGQPGEMESTGKVKPGDALVAVQGRVVHGMNHVEACDVIRRASRPVTLTFIRPPKNAPSDSEAVQAIVQEIRTSSATALSKSLRSEPFPKKARVEPHRPIAIPTESSARISTASESAGAHRASPSAAPTVSRARSRTPSLDVQSTSSVHSAPPNASLLQLDQVPVAARASQDLSVTVSTLTSSPTEDAATSQHQNTVMSYRQSEVRPTRTPSPGLSSDGRIASHLKQQASVNSHQPREESPQLRDSGHLQTVLIPAHLASRASVPLRSSTPQAGGQLGPERNFAPSSQHGAPLHGTHAAGSNGNQNRRILTAPRRVDSAAGPVFTGSEGRHPFEQPATSISGPHNYLSMNSRSGDFPEMRSIGVSRPPYIHAPSNHVTPNGQVVRHSYAAYRHDPVVSSNFRAVGNNPIGHHPSQASANGFQPIPVRNGGQFLPEDERSRNMTLGDFMTYTAQRERSALRAAARQRHLDDHEQSSHLQHSTSNADQISPHPAPPPPTARVPVRRQSSPPSESEEGASFLGFDVTGEDEDDEEAGPTGTSFLSLNQTSFLDDIPINVKPNARKANNESGTSSVRSSANSRDLSRPLYLGKYSFDDVVEVVITQPRLYLTLAPMGRYVSISSFVRGDSGEMGEIEASGKVLAGDVLIGVGSVEIPASMTPGNVARIVTSQPRPYSVFFIRATWEMLE